MATTQPTNPTTNPSLRAWPHQPPQQQHRGPHGPHFGQHLPPLQRIDKQFHTTERRNDSGQSFPSEFPAEFPSWQPWENRDSFFRPWKC